MVYLEQSNGINASAEYAEIKDEIAKLSQKIEDMMLTLENLPLMAKDTMNLRECAKYLGCSEHHVYHLVAKKSIPYSKPAGKLLFSKRELEKWVANSRIATNEEISAQADEYLARRDGYGKR